MNANVGNIDPCHSDTAGAGPDRGHPGRCHRRLGLAGRDSLATGIFRFRRVSAVWHSYLCGEKNEASNGERQHEHASWQLPRL